MPVGSSMKWRTGEAFEAAAHVVKLKATNVGKTFLGVGPRRSALRWRGALAIGAALLSFLSTEVHAGAAVTSQLYTPPVADPLSLLTFNGGLSTAQNTIAERGAVTTGSINSPGGTLRASSSTPLPLGQFDFAHYLTAESVSTLSDTLVFSGTNSFRGSFEVTILGSATASNYIDVGGGASGSRGEGQFRLLAQYSGGAASDGVIMATECPINQVDCVAGNSFREIIEVPFEITSTIRHVSFSATLGAYASFGATADFGQSAYFRLLDIPNGTTFTSSTGFLSDPTPIPDAPVAGTVPEPSVLALSLFGMIIVVAGTRSRRSRHGGGSA